MSKLNTEPNMELVKQGLAQYIDYTSLINDHEKNIIGQFLVALIPKEEASLISQLLNNNTNDRQDNIEFFKHKDNKSLEYCKWLDETHFVSTIYSIDKETGIKIKEQLYKTSSPIKQDFTWLASKTWEYNKGQLLLNYSQDCLLFSENLIFLESKQEEYQRYQKCLRIKM